MAAKSPPNFLMVLDDEDQAVLLKKLDSELSFAWDALHIPMDVQARLAQLGFADLDIWSKLEDDPKEARQLVVNEIGLRRGGNDDDRQIASRLLPFMGDRADPRREAQDGGG